MIEKSIIICVSEKEGERRKRMVNRYGRRNQRERESEENPSQIRIKREMGKIEIYRKIKRDEQVIMIPNDSNDNDYNNNNDSNEL